MKGKIIVHIQEVDDCTEMGLDVDVQNVNLMGVVTLCTALCNSLGVPDEMKPFIAAGLVSGLSNIDDEQFIRDEAMMDQVRKEKGWDQ